MERGLLGEYFKGPCFHSQGQFQATWNESAQNILGKAQSPADWCRAFLLVHVQTESRSVAARNLKQMFFINYVLKTIFLFQNEI